MRNSIRRSINFQASLHSTDPYQIERVVQRADKEQRMEETYEQILLVLASSGTLGFTARVLADHFGMDEQGIRYVLDKLVRHQFGYASPPSVGHIKYTLTGKGKPYLEEKHLIQS